MAYGTTSYEHVLAAFDDCGLAYRETRPGVQARAQTPGHSGRTLDTVITYTDGLTLVYSHDGDTDETLEAVGLTKADLFDNKKEKVYHYPGTRQVVRTPNKIFRQIGGTKEKHLYKSNELADGVVYIVEGEKDVDSIRTVWGLNAVSQAQGANTSPEKADWSPLAGRDVIIIADNDDAGRKRAEKVLRHIEDDAASVQVACAAVGKDASDHIAAGHGPDELVPVNEPWALTRAQQIRLRFDQVAHDGDWLTHTRFPELKWTIPGVMPEGLALLAAAPKIGKSWLACDLAIACAAGGRALGTVDVEKRPVLYFALEDSERRLQDRFHTITHGLPIPKDVHVIVEVAGLPELIALAEHMQDRCGKDNPPLIIIDTLGRVMQGRDRNQSQYEADYQVGARLQNLAKRVPGCTVLVIHHTNKGKHDDFLDAVSGTQGVAGAYDTVLVLSRERKSAEGVLAVTGRDITNETEYGLVSDGGRWQLMGGDLEQAEQAAEEVKQRRKTDGFGDLKSQILAEVNRLTEGDSTTPAEVALRFKIDNTLAGNYLGQLYKSGLVGKSGRGRYVPMKPMKAMKAQANTGNNVVPLFTSTDETSET